MCLTTETAVVLRGFASCTQVPASSDATADAGVGSIA